MTFCINSIHNNDNISLNYLVITKKSQTHTTFGEWLILISRSRRTQNPFCPILDRLCIGRWSVKVFSRIAGVKSHISIIYWFGQCIESGLGYTTNSFLVWRIDRERVLENNKWHNNWTKIYTMLWSKARRQEGSTWCEMPTYLDLSAEWVLNIFILYSVDWTITSKLELYFLPCSIRKLQAAPLLIWWWWWAEGGFEEGVFVYLFGVIFSSRINFHTWKNMSDGCGAR